MNGKLAANILEKMLYVFSEIVNMPEVISMVFIALFAGRNKQPVTSLTDDSLPLPLR